MLHEEGRLVPSTTGNFEYQYNLTDHLGNIRARFRDNAGTAELIQEDHYYPFGMTMDGLSFVGSGVMKSKYLYNGKELQDDDICGTQLDMYDYGARFYQADLGRWNVLDPLAEKYHGITPYRYGLNNPLRFIDPDGKTERERALMVAWAKDFVAMNNTNNVNLATGHHLHYIYAGWHQGIPGMGIDCSGMVSQSSYYSGMGYLNNASKGQVLNSENNKWRGNNGVANIINQGRVRPVSAADVQPGNLVTMSDRLVNEDGIAVGHIAIIESVYRDEKGNITGLDLLHSSGSKGPEDRNVSFTKSNRYSKYISSMNFWASDTDDPLIDAIDKLLNPTSSFDMLATDFYNDIMLDNIYDFNDNVNLWETSLAPEVEPDLQYENWMYEF